MGHGANTPYTGRPPRTPLTPGNAQQVATTLQALSTPSRLLILARLREGPCAATELATAVGMEQSACSHQLRLLRNLGLVTGTRQGRSVVYSLHDNHVAALLPPAVSPGHPRRRGPPPPPPAPPPAPPAGAVRRAAATPVAPAAPVGAVD
ncbi:ArsR/SmtB family transcription factor [Streptomyces sp. 8L]|uniref:ArsR/SmtB family transcription factor n=1 Tax=Streptomyces sp. 8L TaxID=2877242 RepID=UPI001CD22B0F|nr:metalloregulator ArsR/SmtB family transcription factor [Streptomyces sp. 8L]MCA1221903.1 metalloregulator ArsR/SmtB family transcription factor [Streptomyces sp. 8L]